MKYVFFLLIVFTFGCQTSQSLSSRAVIGPQLDEGEYLKLLESQTRGQKSYRGFYNVFDVKSLLLTPEVHSALLQRQSDFMQWDLKHATKEREKMFQEISSETFVVVSLFTPETKWNDLHKGSSVWKIYLKVNGETYEGVAQLEGLKKVEQKHLYPFYNRWSKVYRVKFQLPSSAISGSKPELIITSSLGQASLQY